MRRRLAMLLALLCVAAPAREAKLAWNPNPEQNILGYRVYRLTSIGPAYLSQVPEPQAVVQAATGDRLAVSALNDVGESALSEPVTVPPPPLVLTIQASTDLKTWRDVQTVQVPQQYKEFFRLKMEYPDPP